MVQLFRYKKQPPTKKKPDASIEGGSFSEISTSLESSNKPAIPAPKMHADQSSTGMSHVELKKKLKRFVNLKI